MNNRKHIIFVVNPIAGGKSKTRVLAAIESGLDRDMYDYEIVKTEYAGHATEIARKAVEESVDIVVAIGGDGTVNEVGCGLVNSDTALGIIPCGSGNGLARHLGISMYPKWAVKLLNEGFVDTVDYGLVDGHPFFCTCGVGFDAFISAKFAEAKGRGMKTYVENTINGYFGYKPEVYTLEHGEKKIKSEAFIIACGNASQYGNNAYIAPKASIRDGLMDIIILKPFNVLETGHIAVQLFTKRLDQNRHIEMLREKSVVIHRESEGMFHYDGDPQMGGKDLKVEIVEKGLKIVCRKKK